ncbi:MAG: heavy-metal-associated domain-containing protein [Kofleriaceae bacterium]
MITTLAVSGMTCNGCVKHVDKALRSVPGVSAVEVSLGENSAKVVHDGPVTTLVEAVHDAGYSASPK